MRTITIKTHSPSTGKPLEVTGTVVPTEYPCKSNGFLHSPAYASVASVTLITPTERIPIRCDMYTHLQIEAFENALLEAAAEIEEKF